MLLNFCQLLINKPLVLLTKLKKGIYEIFTYSKDLDAKSLPEDSLATQLVETEPLPATNSEDIQSSIKPLTTSFVIGRRLLPDHFENDEHGNRFVLMKAFLDSRIGENLSFDSLGSSGNIDKKIVNKLKPIIKKHWELTSQKYVAWAGLKKNTIANFKVYSTPDDDSQNPNQYHCDLDRSNYPTKDTARALAYELAALANKDNLHETTDVDS